MILNPGDFFCTNNPAWFGKGIRFIENFWSRDVNIDYSHSGIITDNTGKTIEALTRVKVNSLDAYKDEKVIIGRWVGMSADAYQKGLSAIKDDIGDIYPAWRLLFFMTGTAKWASVGKFEVCSELVCKFLIGAGFTLIETWKGQDPQDVADMIHKWKDIMIVFEGVWEEM